MTNACGSVFRVKKKEVSSGKPTFYTELTSYSFFCGATLHVFALPRMHKSIRADAFGAYAIRPYTSE